MKLHRYVDHQRLHIVTKDVISLSISVLLLFRHYISHKITFGAPSSGGVFCSACGAFITALYGTMGVIPNPKMAFLFPISCILVLIFPIFMTYFPKCEVKGSFPKSQIKSLGQGHTKCCPVLSTSCHLCTCKV